MEKLRVYESCLVLSHEGTTPSYQSLKALEGKSYGHLVTEYFYIYTVQKENYSKGIHQKLFVNEGKVL